MHQEDHVVNVVATFFRSRRFLVLTEGANQGSGFRYRTVRGGWKAPDLVVQRGRTILVCEAKLRSADLFRSSSSVSDYGALTDLITSTQGVGAIKAEAQRRISGLGFTPPSGLLVGSILLSGGQFNVTQLVTLASSPLIGAVIDLDLRTVAKWHNWRRGLRARS